MQHSSPSSAPPALADGIAPRASRVQSVDRAVRLLQAVATASGVEATTAMLGETCGLNRATAWRSLSTMESHGLVACQRENGQWTIGRALVELAQLAGTDALRQAAHGTLERLSMQSGETAALALVTGGALSYVDDVTPSAVVSASWRGRTVPLHATSTGKALLAFSDGKAHRFSRRELVRYTSTTIVTPSEMVEELAETRRRGYGVCRGEYEESAWGVSSPVLNSHGRPVAVLSLWGPGDRITEERLAPLGELVREAALRLGTSR
jgi:DNA-binding IclR family transcriptional regulator